jgi:hypothetical protein
LTEGGLAWQGKALEFGMSSPSRLKILGGVARGKRLDSPEVHLRPMMGKVGDVMCAGGWRCLVGF